MQVKLIFFGNIMQQDTKQHIDWNVYFHSHWDNTVAIETVERKEKENITRVRNRPDITIWNSLFGLCLFPLFLSFSIVFVFLSFCLFVFLSVCLFVFLSFCLFVFLSFCLFVFLSFCLLIFSQATKTFHHSSCSALVTKLHTSPHSHHYSLSPALFKNTLSPRTF